MFALFSPAAGVLLVTAVLTLTAPGCQLLSEVMSLLGVDLLGVTPASDFRQTGNVEFSLLPKADGGGVSLGSFSSRDLDVEVENDDGTMTECDYVDEDVVEASPFNSIALVIDDSGSMGNAYPQDEYGDLCTTCPHDPMNVRADAAAELISHVHGEAPYSRIAVMDFGPEADPGMQATRVLADFTDQSDTLLDALTAVDGTQMVGTPMWDSLAEIILATDDDADDFEDLLRRNGPTVGNPGRGDDTDTGDEDPTAVDIGADDQGSADDVDLSDPDVRRMIVVISDGDDRDSVSYTLDDVIRLANENDVVIHAIGLGPASASNTDPRLLVQGQIATVQNLQRLAESTGGYYAAAEDAEALTALYENIAASMTEGYAETTFSCQPAESAASFASRRVPSSGDRVRGNLSLGSGIQIPWTFIAP
jgi:hypothetical protein